jgi:sporulation protein YlmC with PRC-barrel domain
MSSAEGRELYAARELLDHQIVDSDGMLAGKVDDLELDEGTKTKGPAVVAILSGPGALSGQFGKRLGPWLESVQRRLHPDGDPGPARIGFGVVKRVKEHVTLSVPREELESTLAERWSRDVVIDKIPGAGHAAD